MWFKTLNQFNENTCMHTETGPLVLVLDTNVCLDLFVFHDARWALLMTGLQNGTLRAITSTACRDEWLAVLQYTHLPVNEQNRAGIIEAFDELITCSNPLSSTNMKLPVCTDPDDQKFMEHARDGKVACLITKDKALLKCAKKVAQSGLFQIMSPESFLKLMLV